MPTPLRTFRPPRVLALAALPALVLGLGCGGDHFSGDHAAAANTTVTLSPAIPTVITGQSLQLQLNSPWSTDAFWSVLPASAGTITADGLFTASQTPGSCTILAVWTQDVRYTASVGLTIYLPPVSLVTTPNFVQGPGSQQATPGGAVTNGDIVGENVPATTSTSANGVIQNRAGFTPPIPLQ